MRIEALLAVASVGAMTIGLLGCSSSDTTPSPPTTLSGQASAAAVYPPGPFGTGVGSQVENFDFVGYADAATNHSTMQLIQFADFYNPHAFDQSYSPASAAEDDRLFPPGSQYGAGLPKPTVLSLDVASVWCGPCNEEAECVLPALHKRYAPCGGEFMLQLADGPDEGVAAVPANLVAWTEQYKVNFPSAVDPEYKTEVLWAAEAFPENILIDTTSMTIIDRIAGVPPTQICEDESALCSTTSAFGTPDLSSACQQAFALGVSLPCASGSSCNKFEYWQNFEAHLDKSRAGCEVN
jgi:hypothetical protein